jgi:hypothetical protein
MVMALLKATSKTDGPKLMNSERDSAGGQVVSQVCRHSLTGQDKEETESDSLVSLDSGVMPLCEQSFTFNQRDDSWPLYFADAYTHKLRSSYSQSRKLFGTRIHC